MKRLAIPRFVGNASIFEVSSDCVCAAALHLVIWYCMAYKYVRAVRLRSPIQNIVRYRVAYAGWQSSLEVYPSFILGHIDNLFIPIDVRTL